MNYSRKKSRRSRRGGAVSALSPASVSGGRRRRSRRSRRGGGVGSPLSPAPVGTLSSARDTSIPSYGIDGVGLTDSSSQGGPLTQALTAGSRSRRSRRDRR